VIKKVLELHSGNSCMKNDKKKVPVAQTCDPSPLEAEVGGWLESRSSGLA
jgi:hypothetical protein